MDFDTFCRTEYQTVRGILSTWSLQSHDADDLTQMFFTKIAAALRGRDVLLLPGLSNVSDIPSNENRLEKAHPDTGNSGKQEGCDRSLKVANTTIVAEVDGNLHFRIYNSRCQVVEDASETVLVGATDGARSPGGVEQAENRRRQIEVFKERLQRLWPPHELTASERYLINESVWSIVVLGQVRELRAWLFSSLRNLTVDHFHGMDQATSDVLIDTVPARSENGEYHEEDLEYSLYVFNNALQLTKLHCDVTGLRHIWDVFESWMPARADGCDAPQAIDRVQARYEALSRQNIQNRLTSAKRAIWGIIPGAIPPSLSDHTDPEMRVREWIDIVSSAVAVDPNRMRLVLCLNDVPPIDASMSHSVSMIAQSGILEEASPGASDRPWSDDELRIMLSFRLRTPLTYYVQGIQELAGMKLFEGPARCKLKQPSRPLCLLTFLAPTPEELDVWEIRDRVALFQRIKASAKWSHHLWSGFDLELMSSKNGVYDLPKEGKKTIIVADVQNVLRFRIFDAGGKMVVDTDENRLPEKREQIAELRSRLGGRRDGSQPSQRENDSIVAAVRSIVGRTHSGHAIPQEISKLTYNLAIVLALVECGAWISDLKDPDVAKNVHWVLNRPWLDERLRSVFQRGQGLLSARRADDVS